MNEVKVFVRTAGFAKIITMPFGRYRRWRANIIIGMPMILNGHSLTEIQLIKPKIAINTLPQ